jgi:zinc protease
MGATTRQAMLNNGLRVILREVHSAPVTSTWLWYRVGSRNELGADTGISHWVEHMMFKGATQFPKGEIMRAVDRLGGYVNAMTSHDFTVYYATLPGAEAELALQFEADRMTSALFDPQEVEAERTVIIAEREGGENEPSYMLAEEVSSVAFRVHPYRHQTIGWKEDLLHITRDQLHAQYRRYYVPNNAVLVVVGDFEAEDWLRRIERYFGGIAPGPEPAQWAPVEPPQRGERRVTLRMPGAAPIVRLSFHTPPVSAPDYVPLVIADAVLSGGKAMFAFGDSQTRSARLYRALVETELASSAGSSYHPSLDPYLFTLGATVRQGRTPEEVEAALLAEVDKLRQSPVEGHELEVAIRQTQAQFAYSSESVTSQALTLGFLEMLDRHERMETILDELAAVTPDDVLRVAQTYFSAENRIAGWFVPSDEAAQVEADPIGSGDPMGSGDPTGSGDPQRSHEVAHWAPPRRGMCAYRGRSASIGPDSVVHATLDNGATVLVRENPASATVAIGGYLIAGGAFEREGQVGLAAFTAAMLRRGTRTRTFQEINIALDDVGASLEAVAGRDDVSFGGRALASDIDLLIDLLAEMLVEPTFPESETNKLRGQLLTRLSILEMDTGYRSDQALVEALYPPEHPYARHSLGTRGAIAALTRDDLVAFIRSVYHPETLALCVVGAIEPGRVIARLNATIGQWRTEGPAPVWHVPAAETPAGVITRRVNIPGRPQIDLILGVVGMARSSPDYYPAVMANVILGRLGLMGRLGQAVRDEQGLAYYVSSTVQTSLGARPWSVMAGVQPQHIEPAVSSILRELVRMRDEPVSEGELADCKSYLIGSLPLELETNEGMVSFLLNVHKYGLGLDYMQRYPDLVGAVTRAMIQQAVARYFRPERYVLAMAGTLEGNGLRAEPH